MYLSCLQIEVGQAAGRAWLASPYRVHQRLCAAFPEGGVAGRVLFRVEEGREPPRVIVQSPIAGDWQKAFGRTSLLLATPLQKEVNLGLCPGQRLRFLLRANPTKRLGAKEESQRLGKRVGLRREADQRAWLERKAEEGGFQPLDYAARPLGTLALRRGSGEEARTLSLLGVEFEGLLQVADPERLLATMAAGLGAGKGLGFGLLSLAPA